MIETEIKKLLDDNNLQMDCEIRFVGQPVLTEEIQLAMLILKKNGMKISIVLKPKPNK